MSTYCRFTRLSSLRTSDLKVMGPARGLGYTIAHGPWINVNRFKIQFQEYTKMVDASVLPPVGYLVVIFLVEDEGPKVSSLMFRLRRSWLRFQSDEGEQQGISRHRRSVLRAAIRKARQVLSDPGFEFPGEDGRVFDLEENDLEPWPHQRDCSFQSKGQSGLLCDANSKGGDDSDRLTSQALCNECNLPDDFLRCSFLAHPHVNLFCQDLQAERYERGVQFAICGQGKNKEVSQAPQSCSPGGHPCWQLVVEQKSFLDALSAGIEARVLDELDHLNLRFKAAMGSRLLEPTQFRSVGALSVECAGQENFKLKIQALADLLARVRVSSHLKGTPAAGAGSISHLEELISENAWPISAEAIKIFRAIAQLRQDFPAHSGTDSVLKATRRLGISYPISDWDQAWRKVLRAFVGAVVELRRGIPDT